MNTIIDYSYYEQLESADIDNSTNPYDQLLIVNLKDFTNTNDHHDIMTSIEDLT